MFKYEPPANLLKDKIILVTGAGSGIGRAVSLAYAENGATVILSGKSVEKLEAVYDEIEANGGSQPAIFPLDLETAGENDYMTLASGIENEFGRLDGLLSNAGMTGPLMPIQTFTLENWHKVLQVNLTAAFALSKYTMPLLNLADDPAIIFTSSTAGRKVSAYWGAYNVAKHGLETLMQTLFLELENTSKIRVNTVNPGPCATALRQAVLPNENPDTIAQPEELVALYLYLMGKDSLGENGKQFSAQKQPGDEN